MGWMCGDALNEESSYDLNCYSRLYVTTKTLRTRSSNWSTTVKVAAEFHDKKIINPIKPVRI